MAVPARRGTPPSSSTACSRSSSRRESRRSSCYKCFENKDCRCANGKDVLNGILAKMIEADGILLASPTYFSNMTAEMKALIDRCGLVSTANGGLFVRKVGAALAVARRAGAVTTFDALNHFLLYNQMLVPGSCYWPCGEIHRIIRIHRVTLQ